MLNKEIREYIKKSLEQGFSEEKIKQELLKIGWQKEEIEENFSSLKEKMFPKESSSLYNIFAHRRFLIPLISILAGVIFIGGFFIYQKFFSRQLFPVVQAGEGYVPVNLPIQIEFPHRFAKLEEIKDHFSLKPPIAGKLLFDGRILTLEHEKNLKYGTDYTITISKGINIGLGIRTQDDFTLSFSTRPRAEKRILYLNSYSNFQSYALNYYDSEYEVFVSPAKEGEYIFKIYQSSPEKILEAFFAPIEWDKQGQIIRSKSYYTSSDILDSQTISLKKDDSKFSPNISDQGIYFVEVRSKDNKETFSFFLVLSKNVITTKRLGDKLVSWVVNQRTSAGVAEAEVKAIGKKTEEVLFSGKTNRQGLYEEIVSQKDLAKKPSIVISQVGEDTNFNFLTAQWHWSIYSSDFSNALDKYKAYIYTDRPIYRPGDKINFKAILRENGENQYLPLNKEVLIKAQEVGYGEEKNIIYEEKLSTNFDGSLAGSFNLTKEVKSGEYIIEVELGEDVLGGANFNIEFYQKPDFEVLITTDKEKYIKGEEIKTKISASYFFGGPLENSQVHWQVYHFNGEIIKEGEAKFDPSGELDITIPTKDISFAESVWWDWDRGSPLTIEAEVVDVGGESSTKSYSVTAFEGEYDLSLKEPINTYGLEVNKSYKFVIEAEENLSGNPVKSLPVKIEFIKSSWESSHNRKEESIKEFDTSTDVLGESEFKMEFSSVGNYNLVVSAKDSFQNEIKESFYLSLRDNDIFSFQESKKDFVDKILITPSKESYKIGEKAKIKLYLPRPKGEIFWSVNKQTFKKYDTEEISGYEEELEILISEDLVPGFYLYVNLFQDDVFIEANQFIKVEGKKLKVEVLPVKSELGPKQGIELNIRITDEEGSPVAAETSLSVIDKAILALKSDQTADIYDAFYPEPDDWLKSLDSLRVIAIGLAESGGCFVGGTKILMADGSVKNIEEVRTGDFILTKESSFSDVLVKAKVTKTFEHLVGEYLIINDFLKITPIHRIFVNGQWETASKIKLGDWLLTEKGEKLFVNSIKKKETLTKVYNLEIEKYHTFFANGIYVHNQKGEAEVRSKFVDTAYWNAYIFTDSRGEASVKFTLPDNLTTWAALAKAITKDTKAGQGKGEFKTSKNLIIRPALPQFLRTNDEIYIHAAIHNDLGRTSNFKASLKAEGASVLEEPIKNLEIAEGIKDIIWKIKAEEKKSAKLTFSVEEQGGSSDAVELALPIYSSLNLVPSVVSGFGASKIEFSVDPDSSQEYSSAIFTLTPSVLAALPGIIDKLSGYPYGCVEQTMSKHLPNILAIKNQSALGLAPKENIGELIKEGLDRLLKFQHEDGGFGWWENDENNVWMSGYVMEGLIETKTAGLLGNRDSIYNKLLDYLKKNINTFGEQEKIYIYYVLSKAGINDFVSQVGEMTDEILAGKNLDIQSKGYLALTLYHSGKIDKAKQLLSLIKEGLENDHWETEKDYASMKDLYSATGVNLLALITIDYNETIAQGIVQWLMNNRIGYEGLWGSTRQSSQILLALMEYLTKTKELEPNFSYEIYLNEELLKKGSVNNPKYVLDLEIPFQKMRSVNTLELKKQGEGNPFFTVLFREYLSAEKIVRENSDLRLTREYVDLAGNKISKFSRGDLIKVRLNLSNTKNLSFVIIEDFLPAGFEPQNPRLENVKGQSQYGDIALGEWYESLDIRDEKVAIFRRDFWPASHTFEYLVRVGYTGNFKAPAPRAELMYEPQNYGIGEPYALEIGN